jgi:hypothetical protein
LAESVAEEAAAAAAAVEPAAEEAATEGPLLKKEVTAEPFLSRPLLLLLEKAPSRHC